MSIIPLQIIKEMYLLTFGFASPECVSTLNVLWRVRIIYELFTWALWLCNIISLRTQCSVSSHLDIPTNRSRNYIYFRRNKLREKILPCFPPQIWYSCCWWDFATILFVLKIYVSITGYRQAVENLRIYIPFASRGEFNLSRWKSTC